VWKIIQKKSFKFTCSWANIQDYIQGCNVIFTISISVWFASINVNKIYVLPSFSGGPWDVNPIQILKNQLHELENP
jgi:hypothetical protein